MSKNKLPLRKTTDAPLDATPEELKLIRGQLAVIERLVTRLFGKKIYSREPASLETRADAADLIERHFDGIIEQWAAAVVSIFAGSKPEEP
ncbi:MAG TPA: hypothetical protein VIX12_10105, partial [Candidatus Binataceae bacterium]